MERAKGRITLNRGLFRGLAQWRKTKLINREAMYQCLMEWLILLLQYTRWSDLHSDGLDFSYTTDVGGGERESWYPCDLHERSSSSYKMTSQPTTYGYSLFVSVSSLSVNVWWFRQGSLPHQWVHKAYQHHFSSTSHSSDYFQYQK